MVDEVQEIKTYSCLWCLSHSDRDKFDSFLQGYGIVMNTGKYLQTSHRQVSKFSTFRIFSNRSCRTGIICI